MKKKASRITVVIGSLNRGGAETHLLNILPRLDRALFDIDVFVLSERGELASEMERLGVPVSAPWFERNGGARSLLSRIFALVAISIQLWVHLLLKRPKIVHFFLPASYCIGGIVSLFAAIPHRIMSRRSRNHYQAKYPLIGRFEKYLHKTISYALGNSKAVIDDLYSEGISKEKTKLIYNGVDFSKFKEFKKNGVVRKELSIADDRAMMVLVANLIPYKGHRDLIEALRLLPSLTQEKWHMVCVGRDDGIGRELQDLAEQAGIAPFFTLTGARSDIPQILGDADIGLLVSHEEGFSNAVLEGMAAALPMVVTDVGGNAEAIVDGVTGFVVPAKFPERIAQALATLLNDRGIARRMGEASSDRAQKLFSMEACVREYNGFYRNLLKL